MEKIEWKNERRRIRDLVPWDKNPRKISEEQLEHLKKSIEKFNYAAPVVVTPAGKIVAGHMRTRALLALGRGDDEVDVRVASRELTEEEFKELAVRDNANGGEWDLDLLAGFGVDFLKDLGMEDNFLSKIAKKSRAEQAEEAPDPPPGGENQARPDVPARRSQTPVRRCDACGRRFNTHAKRAR